LTGRVFFADGDAPGGAVAGGGAAGRGVMPTRLQARSAPSPSVRQEVHPNEG
jgi:hypothetical protein